MTVPRTPSQTIGPFFAVALPWIDGPWVVPEGTPGAVWIRGSVLDGEGHPVPDAMIETWQADPDGRFPQPEGRRGGSSNFRGFGRCATDANGRFAIRTLLPGPVPSDDGAAHAPHVDVSVFARGLLTRLVTRIYFPEGTAAHAVDPVLSGVTDPEARATLIAERTDDGYRFDIHLQGERETVFFDL